MVYKTKFLKQRVVEDYAPAADGTYTWELTDQALAAIWISISGPLVTGGQKCVDDMLEALLAVDVWFGGFNVVHYASPTVDSQRPNSILMMNSLLKQNMPYFVANSQTAADIAGVSFPILFGAPYLNLDMALPASLSNRKTLSITLDDANTAFDHTTLDICEVVLPGAMPRGFIKQEQIHGTFDDTGDYDVWLQRNWDLLKLLLWGETKPVSTTKTATWNRVGFEIDDFAFGYKAVPWEHLHCELMDEVGGPVGLENHTHDYTSTTDYAQDLEHWIAHYGVLDFFYEKDLKWRAPLSTASTVKLKVNRGVADCYMYTQANYVPTTKVG